ncbi:MAG: S-layer homology domain-containing protein [Tissierellia bacterium]|nr:S-layer homology domain-containing protein [Tissierellia bacterium]
MGKFKKLLSLASISILLITCSEPVNANVTYSDMGGHWSTNYVTKLSDSNLINGYDDGTFKPNNDITKAEFFKIINNLAGLKKSYSVTFKDVSRSDWFYDEVAKGIKAGYIVPTTGNLYPEKPITRQEAMYIIGYMYDLTPMPESLKNFSDASLIREDAKGYVGALIFYGIVDGYPDGEFKPDNPISRGEVSKILDLLISKLKAPDEKVILDSEIKFGAKDHYK